VRGVNFLIILLESTQCVMCLYRSTLPNINKVRSQSANEDLTLPEGANGRLYGISVVRSTCPPGAPRLFSRWFLLYSTV